MYQDRIKEYYKTKTTVWGGISSPTSREWQLNRLSDPDVKD